MIGGWAGNFEETNSTRKKHTPPLKERIHWPENRKPLYWFLIAFVILVVVALLAGGLPRLFRDRDIDKRSKEEKSAKPVVETAKVVEPKDQAGLAVPGTTIPLTQAYVYARANGYLKKRYVDIGDRVKRGSCWRSLMRRIWMRRWRRRGSRCSRRSGSWISRSRSWR